jgi:hypothetical protein
MTGRQMIKAYALGMALVLALCAPLTAADTGSEIPELERLLLKAKAAFDANPSAVNQLALAKAEEAYKGLLPLPTKAAGPRAIVSEVEPNDSAATATALTAGDSGTGSIDPAGDIDWWSRAGAAVGDLVLAYVDTENSTNQDSQLNIYNNDGTTLIVFDDDSGPGLSSCAAGSVAQAGNVLFRINEYNDDGQIIPYELYQLVVKP